MKSEIEAKWLDIDIPEMRNLLENIGASLVAPERLMSRKTYDYADSRLANIGGWVRVRDEGDKVTLSYKQLKDRTLHGTKEITVIVHDFNTTCNFLESIGLVQKSYQQTKRESWRLGTTEIELDTWPWIPSFVEIEAKSKKQLLDVASKLGFNYADALYGSVETAYQAVYDVTEEEIDNYKEILFIETPEWLLKAKKQTRS